MDTVRCDDLSFDYSQLSSTVVDRHEPSDHFVATRSAVAWSGSGKVSVEVLSILGTRVLSSTIDAEHALSLESLPRGAYIIRASDRSVPAIRYAR